MGLVRPYRWNVEGSVGNAGAVLGRTIRFERQRR